MKGDNLKEAFLNQYFDQESQNLKSVRDRIEDKFDRDISIQFYEAQILKHFVKSSNVKNILEIGTFGAYSTIAMAEELGEGGKLITLEKNQENADFSKENIDLCNLSSKIEVMVGDAHQSINNLVESSKVKFDLVFIDAEKKGYPKYLDEIQPILNKGAIIIADNIFLGSAIFDESKISKKNASMVEAMQEFLTKIKNLNKYNTIIIPTEEGMSVSRILS